MRYPTNAAKQCRNAKPLRSLHNTVSVLGVMLLSGCTLLTGCRDEATQTASPLEVAQQIVDARAKRDLATITAHITTDDREALGDFLLAVDEFNVEAVRLRNAVAKHIGGGLSRGMDLTHLTAELALFSEQVELLDETITGERATVAFVLAGRLPTKRADFVLESAHWRYDPGDLTSQQFGPAFRELARGLAKVSDAVEAGTFDAETIRNDPQPLLEEFRRKLEPGMKLMPKPE